MPFRRKRSFKRRRYAKRKPFKRLVKRIRRFERSVETKYVDTNVVAGAVSSTGSLGCLNTPILGTNAAQRIGEKVTNSSLIIKGTLTYADPTNLIRLIVFWAKQPHGTAPFPADILSTSASAPITSNRNWPQRKGFKVIFDRVYLLNDSDLRQRKFKIWKKLKGVHTMYVTNTGTFADIDQNALWFMYISDSGIVAHPTITFNARWKYRDI